MNEKYQHEEIKTLMMFKWNVTEHELDVILKNDFHIFESFEDILMAKSYFENRLTFLQNPANEFPYEQIIRDFEIKVIDKKLKLYDDSLTFLKTIAFWSNVDEYQIQKKNEMLLQKENS